MQLNTVKEIKTRPISLTRPTSTKPYPPLRFDTDTANIWFKICHPHTQDIYFFQKNLKLHTSELCWLASFAA